MSSGLVGSGGLIGKGKGMKSVLIKYENFPSQNMATNFFFFLSFFNYCCKYMVLAHSIHLPATVNIYSTDTLGVNTLLVFFKFLLDAPHPPRFIACSLLI